MNILDSRLLKGKDGISLEDKIKLLNEQLGNVNELPNLSESVVTAVNDISDEVGGLKRKKAYVEQYRTALDSNDDAPIKAAINSLASGGRLIFDAQKEYNVYSQLDLESDIKIDGNYAKINFYASNSILFKFFQNEHTILKDIVLIDKTGTNTAISLEGVAPSNESDYSRKTLFRHVFTVDFNLSLDSNFARKWKVDQCVFYSRNGISIRNKSVEINITDTIIYGSTIPYSFNFGIKLDSDTGTDWHYPEGVMISGCTIDNFYRTLWCNNVFVLQVTNSYIASDITEGDASIYFGKGTASHNQNITIDNVVIFGKGVKFQPNTDAPVIYKAEINAEFENINETNVFIDNFAHSIRIKGKFSPIQNGIVGVCVNNNKNVWFTDIDATEECIGGIQYKGINSAGSRIGNFNYRGTGNALYLEQPIYLASGIQCTDTQSLGYLQKNANLPQGIYALNAAIASVTMNIAKGQKGTITLNGKVSYSGSQPILNIEVPSGISIPNGSGWDSKFILPANGQYLSITVPFYATTDVTNGVFKIDNDTTGGSVTVDYHAYMVVRLSS